MTTVVKILAKLSFHVEVKENDVFLLNRVSYKLWTG